MRQKSMTTKDTAEQAVRDIRRKTRKQYSAEEKIRIVLEGLRGEESIAALLRASGASDFLNDVSIALMGRYRGGGAKVAICASSLFGSISGSVGANIMSTGAFTIPMMKGGGYRAESAGAIEAVASTGG